MEGGGGVFTDFKGRVEKAIPGIDDNFKGWGRENDPREGKQQTVFAENVFQRASHHCICSVAAILYYAQTDQDIATLVIFPAYYCLSSQD